MILQGLLLTIYQVYLTEMTEPVKVNITTTDSTDPSDYYAKLVTCVYLSMCYLVHAYSSHYFIIMKLHVYVIMVTMNLATFLHYNILICLHYSASLVLMPAFSEVESINITDQMFQMFQELMLQLKDIT